MGRLHHQGTWAWPGLSQFCAGCSVLQAGHSFTGTIVSLGHLRLSLLRACEPTGLRGQVGGSTGVSVQVIPLVCAGPVLSPCPKALLGLGSALGSLPQLCQVPAKSLGLPAASPGRCLKRQRCLPALVSFVKAAGMSQDLLSPRERERGGEKGSVSSAPGPGSVGSVGSNVHLCCHRLLEPAGSQTSRHRGRFLAAVMRLEHSGEGGQGDGALLAQPGPLQPPGGPFRKYLTNAELGPEI